MCFLSVYLPPNHHTSVCHASTRLPARSTPARCPPHSPDRLPPARCSPSHMCDIPPASLPTHPPTHMPWHPLSCISHFTSSRMTPTACCPPLARPFNASLPTAHPSFYSSVRPEVCPSFRQSVLPISLLLDHQSAHPLASLSTSSPTCL